MPLRPIPPLPEIHSLSCKTFTCPPLDGSLSVIELYEWHAQHSHSHRFFILGSEPGKCRTILWPEATKAILRASRIVTGIMEDAGKWATPLADTPVVAVLAPSNDSITYNMAVMGIQRANFIAFPISPRNSPAAVAHLLQKVNVQHVLVGREESMSDLFEAVINIFEKQYPSETPPSMSPLLCFSDLFDNEGPVYDKPFLRNDADAIMLYLHSSGSTSFPKPIPWNNQRYLEIAAATYFGEVDLTDAVVSLHSLPMFHSFGVAAAAWQIGNGAVFAFFEPRNPPVMPTPSNILKAAKSSESDFIFSTSASIEAWAQDPESVKWLATRRGLMFGGAPLDKATGDYLYSRGVPLFLSYGLTETGPIPVTMPAKADPDWEYFRISNSVKAQMRHFGDNLYELIIVSHPFLSAALTNTKIDGVDAYATSDLLMLHPTRPGLWKVHGRLDDQIIHNNGEKTNPGPLENILNQDPHVKAAVFFGHGRFQAGVIVEPMPEYVFDPNDEKKLAEFRNKLWSTIQRVNVFAPQHSRIFKEMIITTDPCKPFEYSSKGTARRKIAIKAYEQEINAVYRSFETSNQFNLSIPSKWDAISAISFVREVVEKVMTHPVADEDDLFQHGCDSLQTTWIRNTISHALFESAGIDPRRTVENFVYEHPTVRSLAVYVMQVACETDPLGSEPSKKSRMIALVKKYVASLPKRHPSYFSSVTGTNEPEKAVVVTGTTGGFGSHLLARLILDKRISRVFALNRKSETQTLYERQKTALLDKGLPGDAILSSEKLCLLEADVSQPKFGLADDVYNQMRHSTTHIIHNAWKVDFNLVLSSFEVNIQGLRNLIDFALTTSRADPPTIMYMSSIGIFSDLSKLSETGAFDEKEVDAEVAIANGYSESKWVSEQILAHASREIGLKSVVVRLGQLCGGPDGAWNKHEWFPSLIQVSAIIKCLPSDDKTVSWISLDIAASAIADFCHVTFPESATILHLVHPKPTPLSELLKAFSLELSIPAVSYKEWLHRLEGFPSYPGHKASTELMKDVQALRLLDFYRRLGKSPSRNNLEAFGVPSLSMPKAITFSRTLADSNIRTLGKSDVKAWLGYWRRVGIIPA